MTYISMASFCSTMQCDITMLAV